MRKRTNIARFPLTLITLTELADFELVSTVWSDVVDTILTILVIRVLDLTVVAWRCFTLCLDVVPPGLADVRSIAVLFSAAVWGGEAQVISNMEGANLAQGFAYVLLAKLVDGMNWGRLWC